MNIAIIGPGNMGKGIARLLVAKGYRVALAHRDLPKAQAAAAEIGDHADSADIASAVKRSDVIFLATPFVAVGEAIAAAGQFAGKTIVDITNPLTSNHMALTIGHTTSAAEEIAKLAPDAKVVKAFNTIFWQALAFEVRRGKPPVQVLLASDDSAAKQKVSELVRALEFEPIDAGPLANARYIEPVAQLNILFGYALGWGTAIAPSWVRL